MKKLFAVSMISMMMLAIVGCAAGPNELATIPDEEGRIAGFWPGLWHGFISPFTFLISIHIHQEATCQHPAAPAGILNPTNEGGASPSNS